MVVNLLGIILIGLTLGWFLLSKPRPSRPRSVQAVDILVKDGVYEPSQIRVSAHQALRLHFLRQDPTPCAETVVFTRLNRNYMLPLNKLVEIKLEPQPAGELEFTCEMGMYRGRLVIE